MALIDCPECKVKVSDKAKACPKCGYPIGKNLEETEVANVEKEQLDNEINKINLKDSGNVIKERNQNSITSTFKRREDKKSKNWWATNFSFMEANEFFSFSGKMNRVSYFITTLVIYFIYIVVTNNLRGSSHARELGIIALSLIAIFWSFQVSKRLHDMNWSRLWLVVFLPAHFMYTFSFHFSIKYSFVSLENLYSIAVLSHVFLFVYSGAKEKNNYATSSNSSKTNYNRESINSLKPSNIGEFNKNRLMGNSNCEWVDKHKIIFWPDKCPKCGYQGEFC